MRVSKTMKRTRYAWLAALPFALVLACAPSQVSQERIETFQPAAIPKATKENPAGWKVFFDAEQAYSLKQYDRAAQLYGLAKTRNPGNSRVYLIASYRLGTIHYLNSDFRRASQEFSALLERFPDSDLGFDINYNLAASEFQLRNYERAYELLAAFSTSDIESQGPARASMVYQLTALAATGLGNYAAAIYAYAAQTQLPLSEGKREAIQSKVERLVARLETRAELEKLLASISEPLTRAQLEERLASLPGRVEEMTVAPPRAAESASGDSFASGTSGVTPEPTHIGVALPLTGQWAAFGKRALDAVLLAAKSLKAERRIAFKVFIQDTGSNPLTAGNVVDELVLKNRVFAIIGPINFKEAIAVARRAQRLGVLNVSLTLKEGLSAKGDHIFQNGLTARVQLESLVRYCFEQRQFKRFGILAPKDSFGKDMSDQFWDLVERSGGRITAYEEYPPNETDFQALIRSLTGLDRPKLRPLEFRALQAFLDEQKLTGTRRNSFDIPPNVDFDALFIPDNPKAIAQIAPSLAYLDVRGAPILGTAEWNSPQLYKRGGKWVEGAIFPGGLHLESKSPKQRLFVDAFRSTYGTQPDLLAAQAYEAVEILAEAVSRARSGDDQQVIKEMIKLSDLPTVLGRVTFDETRLARRDLPIFTIQEGGSLQEL